MKSNSMHPFEDTGLASPMGTLDNAADNPCNVTSQSIPACLSSIRHEIENIPFTVGDEVGNMSPETSPTPCALESNSTANNVETTHQTYAVHPRGDMDWQGKPIYSLASSDKYRILWDRNPGEGETYRPRWSRLTQGIETPTTTLHHFPMVSPPGCLNWCQWTHIRKLPLGPQYFLCTHGEPLHPEVYPMPIYNNIATACSANYVQHLHPSGQLRSSHIQQGNFEGAQILQGAAVAGDRMGVNQLEETGRGQSTSTSVAVRSHTASVAEASRFAVGLATIFRPPSAISTMEPTVNQASVRPPILSSPGPLSTGVLSLPGPLPTGGVPSTPGPISTGGVPSLPRPLSTGGVPSSPRPLSTGGVPSSPGPISTGGVPSSPGPISTGGVPSSPRPLPTGVPSSPRPLPTGGHQAESQSARHAVRQDQSCASYTNRTIAAASLSQMSLNEKPNQVMDNSNFTERDNVSHVATSDENRNQSCSDFTRHFSGSIASQGAQLPQGGTHQSPSQWHLSSARSGWSATSGFHPWMNYGPYTSQSAVTTGQDPGWFPLPVASEASNVTNDTEVSNSSRYSQAGTVPMGIHPESAICTSVQSFNVRPEGTQTVTLSSQISSTALYQCRWSLPSVINASVESHSQKETSNFRAGGSTLGGNEENVASANVAGSPTISCADCLSVRSTRVSAADWTSANPDALMERSSSDTLDKENASCVFRSATVTHTCESHPLAQQSLESCARNSDCRKAPQPNLPEANKNTVTFDSQRKGMATSAISFATAVVRGIPAVSPSPRRTPEVTGERRVAFTGERSVASSSSAPNRTTSNRPVTSEGPTAPSRSKASQTRVTSGSASSSRDRIRSTAILEQRTRRMHLSTGSLRFPSSGALRTKKTRSTFTASNSSERSASCRYTTANSIPSFPSNFQQGPLTQAGASASVMSVPIEQSLRSWVQALVSKSTALPTLSAAASVQQGLSSAPYSQVQPNSSIASFQTAPSAGWPAAAMGQGQYFPAPQVLHQETRPDQQPADCCYPAAPQYQQFGSNQPEMSAPRQRGYCGPQHLQQDVRPNPMQGIWQNLQQVAPQYQQQPLPQPQVGWSQPATTWMSHQQQQEASPIQQYVGPWQRQQQAVDHTQSARAMPNQQYAALQNQTFTQQQPVIRVSQSIDISMPPGAPMASFRSATVLPALGIPAPAVAAGRQPTPVLQQCFTWQIPEAPVPPPPPAPQVWYPQPPPLFQTPTTQSPCPPSASSATPASRVSPWS